MFSTGFVPTNFAQDFGLFVQSASTRSLFLAQYEFSRIFIPVKSYKEMSDIKVFVLIQNSFKNEKNGEILMIFEVLN
jgi:hypothetical protein